MIEKIKLNNGIEMPMEGFGVFQIPEEDCEPVVRNAIAEGYRLIDTASSYQNEEAVGRGIRNSGIPREELFITTKAYIQQMGYDNTRTAFEQGVIVIPKSVHKERMRENLNIWDFKLEEADMMRIAQLDKDCPSMLDTRKISEVKRVYDYLNNPVLTSL